MTHFSRRELSPAATELGAIFYDQVLKGGDAEAAFDATQDLGPAVAIGQAAMLLTGKSNAREATDDFLTNAALQEGVRADLAAIEESGVSRIPELRQSQRIARLRELATAGAVDIKNLQRGEPVTAVYKPMRRWLDSASLEVARTHEGTTSDRLGVLVHAMRGDRLHPRRSLGIGQVVFLGYSQNRTVHYDSLQRGTPPSWVCRVVKKVSEDGKESWIYAKLFTDPRFFLDQVYYGRTEQHPLFAEG